WRICRRSAWAGRHPLQPATRQASAKRRQTEGGGSCGESSGASGRGHCAPMIFASGRQLNQIRMGAICRTAFLAPDRRVGRVTAETLVIPRRNTMRRFVTPAGRARLRWMTIALLLAGAAGCTGAKIYPVKGKIEYAGGQPATDLAGYKVEFESIDGKIDGHGASAEGAIQRDGTFQ